MWGEPDPSQDEGLLSALDPSLQIGPYSCVTLGKSLTLNKHDLPHMQNSH